MQPTCDGRPCTEHAQHCPHSPPSSMPSLGTVLEAVQKDQQHSTHLSNQKTEIKDLLECAGTRALAIVKPTLVFLRFLDNQGCFRLLECKSKYGSGDRAASISLTAFLQL